VKEDESAIDREVSDVMAAERQRVAEKDPSTQRENGKRRL
jgi:hypothetical protein